MRLTSLLSLSIFTLLFMASCSSRPQQFYDNGVSDAEYIRIASETEEAQAFLNQFPEAEVFVDRSSRLAVDFRVSENLPATTEQHWEGIRLRVFIDPEIQRAEDALIDCRDQSGGSNFIEDELVEYLEQYVQSQSCP